ncbi:FAD-dependent oxidoreductase [Bacillus pacificus]
MLRKRYEQWRKLYRLSISIPSLFRETVYIMQVKVKMSHFYKREYKTLQNYEFPVEYFTASDIKERYPFTRQAALYTHGDAEVNPYLLAHSLLHKANQMGANIYEHTEAIHIKKTSK